MYYSRQTCIQGWILAQWPHWVHFQVCNHVIHTSQCISHDRHAYAYEDRYWRGYQNKYSSNHVTCHNVANACYNVPVLPTVS